MSAGTRFILLATSVTLVLASATPSSAARRATKPEANLVRQELARYVGGQIERAPGSTEQRLLAFPICVSTVRPSYAKAWVFPVEDYDGRPTLEQPAEFYFRLSSLRARFIGVLVGDTPRSRVRLPLAIRKDLDKRRGPCRLDGGHAQYLLDIGLVPVVSVPD